MKCFGKVKIITPAGRSAGLIMALEGLADEKKRNLLMTYFELAEKRYVPLTDEGEIDQSEDRCKATLERSTEQTQPVGEVVKSRFGPTYLSIRDSMQNRLWLYDGKLYQVSRNDYSQEQVHLLILKFLDKEKKRFKDLQQKYKTKPSS